MAISVRHFVFEESGALRTFSKALAWDVFNGSNKLPQYAGKAIKIADVVVEFEEAKPIAIHDAQGRFWRFDEGGEYVHDWHPGLFLDPFEEPVHSHKVVDLKPKLKRRQWEERNRWTLTAILNLARVLKITFWQLQRVAVRQAHTIL